MALIAAAMAAVDPAKDFGRADPGVSLEAGAAAMAAAAEGIETGGEGAGGDTKPLTLNKGTDQYRLNLNHQEMGRILHELEGNCELVLEQAGVDAWLPVDGLTAITITTLGYEDIDQFEDALGGTFLQFLNALPHMETKIQDDGSSVDGQWVVRMIPPPPLHARYGVELRLTINSSEDLWRTLVKAPDATIGVPELEFEMGVSQSRQIDAVFNHITNACFQLGQYCRMNRETVAAATRAGIVESIDGLTQLLDMPHPWDIVIRDPSGLSMFKPDDGVVKTLLKEPDAGEVAGVA